MMSLPRKRGYIRSAVYAVCQKSTGIVYIGSSRDYKSRFRNHMYTLTKNRNGNPRLQDAWNQSSPQDFEFRVLEKVSCVDDLFDREQHWMSLAGAPSAILTFNVHPLACRSAGARRTAAHKQAQSDRSRTLYAKLSEAERVKRGHSISVAKKGRPIRRSGAHLLCRKISSDDIVKIRSRLCQGDIRKVIATDYRVHISTINAIARRKTGNYVPISDETIAALKSLSNRVARGSKSGGSKLTETDIPTIRQHITNGLHLTAIARAYSVHSSVISNIKTGKTWRHV